MLLNHICSRIKSILLTVIVLFKRALCCFSRKRRNSYAECEILHSVNVVENKFYSSKKNDRERDWNSWDDAPRTVDEHIELYRQKLSESSPPPPLPKEQEIDFFQDMTPKIMKQTKVLLPSNTAADQPNFSRLQANEMVALLPASAELEDWEDNENAENQKDCGWDELDDEKTKQLIRESRKQARAERQQRIKHSKMHQSAK